MSNVRRTEGVFAINKPASITSAQVVRDLQRIFNPSSTFASWIAAETSLRSQESQYQRRRRKQKKVQVKIGHGGTLDPLATGVLIIGIGKGTKKLETFLHCTKTYEATVLFGAATDTYDITGTISSKARYAHITKEKVEEALGKFRGSIMQKPPLYSALRIQGKRLYQYAREGKELPSEIQERTVCVKELKIIEWLEPGCHHYAWPIQAERTQQEPSAELDPIAGDSILYENPSPSTKVEPSGLKRGHPCDDDEYQYSGWNGKEQVREFNTTKISKSKDKDLGQAGGEMQQTQPPSVNTAHLGNTDQPLAPPPAVRLQMTVTSGFYVRSLCHDLGKELGSLAVMASLVRTRQADFQMGKNVLSYEDFQREEEEWGPKVAEMLGAWSNQSIPGEG